MLESANRHSQLPHVFGYKLNSTLLKSLLFASAMSCFAVAHAIAADAPVPDPAYNAYVTPQKLVALQDGRKIHLFCEGVGSPTVIFTAGMGDWSAVWNKVQKPIALKTRTCAWDRAGYGFSSPSRLTQDVEHTTADLEAALIAAEIKGPYLVVGHSMGAFESLRFADRHRGQVAGMVLIDPSIPDQARRHKEVAPESYAGVRSFYDKYIGELKACVAKLRDGTLTLTSADPDECFSNNPKYPLELIHARRELESNPDRWLTSASLLSSFDQSSSDIVDKSRNYGGMPLRVLTAGNPLDAPPSFSTTAAAQGPALKAELLRGHDALAKLSTNGANIIVPETSHYIQLIKPEVVIATISQVIDEIQLTADISKKRR